MTPDLQYGVDPTGLTDIINSRLIASTGLALAVPGLGYDTTKALYWQANGPALAVSAIAVLAATTLTAARQVIKTGITNPDVYRVLEVKPNNSDIGGAGDLGNVIITGTDWNGKVITDTINCPGNSASAVAGSTPFKTVTSISLPAWPDSAGDDTISVGFIDTFGLYRPLLDEDDLFLQVRKTEEGAMAAEAFGTATASTAATVLDGKVAVSTISAKDIMFFLYMTPWLTLFPLDTTVP